MKYPQKFEKQNKVGILLGGGKKEKFQKRKYAYLSKVPSEPH